MEEAELSEVLRSTIANPETKLYKHMISALFSQQTSPANEIMYDMDIHCSHSITSTDLHTAMHVESTLEKLFQQHGAIKLSAPTLMPQNMLYEGTVH